MDQINQTHWNQNIFTPIFLFSEWKRKVYDFHPLRHKLSTGTIKFGLNPCQQCCNTPHPSFNRYNNKNKTLLDLTNIYFFPSYCSFSPSVHLSFPSSVQQTTSQSPSVQFNLHLTLQSLKILSDR